MSIRSRYCWLSLLFSVPFAPSLLSALDELEFDTVNTIVMDIHAPIIAERFDSSVDFKPYYQDFGGSFNRDSVRKPLSEKRFVITLTGEIPTSGPMNMDGYAIVACHEIGHILGGAPYQKKRLVAWSSVEGQADYQVADCMWRYVLDSNNKDVIHYFSPESTERCLESFYGDSLRVLGCMRIMSGIQAVANYFNRTISKDKPVKLLGEDPTEVQKTLEKYPSPQCRVQTLVAGLFHEQRPQCWYAG